MTATPRPELPRRARGEQLPGAHSTPATTGLDLFQARVQPAAQLRRQNLSHFLRPANATEEQSS
ncbi:hypothetical protein AB0D10_00990 [Kitasatospora sp. NPDC048545]|uniref:hypothetical protein n=1 Tax=Kitasatospora sp. NPDC048545 TaxID=3157208 RepID=UPI0033D22EE8